MRKEKPTEIKKNIHTISLLVANKPGVLVRVALVFARRAFNIDALVVSPTVDPKYSRMTITATGDAATLDQIIKQTSKLIDVLHAQEHKHDSAIELELALYKIKCKPANKTAIYKLIKRFQAVVVDFTESSLIIQQTGTTEELDEFENLIKKYEIIEMIRTGKIVMAPGKEPT